MRATVLAGLSLLLAACSDRAASIAPADQAAQNSATPADEAEANTGPRSACVEAPSLDYSERFADPRGEFRDGGMLDALNRRFAPAFARACRNGILARPIVDPRSDQPDLILIADAPEANAVSIFTVDGDEFTSFRRETRLEYPFTDPDGRYQIPSEAQLYEAIYCASHGASESEQQDLGRCLVD